MGIENVIAGYIRENASERARAPASIRFPRFSPFDLSGEKWAGTKGGKKAGD